MSATKPPKRLRAAAYVDGFNFYYRSLRNGCHKWLDLHRLLCTVFPEHDFVAIKYFSADVKDRQRVGTEGTTTSNRQQLYLRALQSTPLVEVIKGRFLVTKKPMPINPIPPAGPIPKVKVVNTEEKGSDVNLATELLLDAVCDLYDLAIVVSVDSDLERPILKVREMFGKPVHLTMGGGERPGKEMRQASGGRFRPISDGALGASQFPESVILPDGSAVTCPVSWRPGYIPPEPLQLPPKTLRGVVKTVKGKFEQGEIDIPVDVAGRLLVEPGQLAVVQRLPILPVLATLHHEPHSASEPVIVEPTVADDEAPASTAKPKRRRRRGRRKRPVTKPAGES